jgi:predicted PurR-regulated permease PerM
MDKKVSVSFTVGTLVTILVVLAGAFALWTLRDLVLLVLTAIVIASAIEPGVVFINRHGVPRVFAVFLMYLVVFGSLFVVLYFFFPPIIADAQQFLSSIPEYLDTLNLPSLSAVTDATAANQSQSLLGQLVTFQQAFTAGSEGIFRLVATFFGGIFSLFLVIVLSFYFAVQETGVEDFLRVVTPPSKEEYVTDLWRRAQRKIGLWMQGQLLLSLIIGVLVYLGLLLVGVAFGSMPYPLLLAVFTAMAELIPIFGSLIAGTAAAAVGYSAHGLPLASAVVGLYIIANQFETNLIYPLVVKKVVGLPPLLVIIALIAGGELAGFLGVLLSVPIAAAAQEFIADLDRAKRNAG